MIVLMPSVADQAAELYPGMLPVIEAAGSTLAPPDRVRQLTEEGLGFYNDGKLEEAAECYRKALEISPDNRLALYALGVISGQLKGYDESKAAFERLALLLKDLGSRATTMAEAHQGIGVALLGLWGAAGPDQPPPELAARMEREFRTAVELDPKYFRAWLGLGVALHILERLEDAEAAFRKAIEIDPHNEAAKERLRSVLEDKLERRLFELGYLSKVNKPIRDFTPYENRTLIRVKGKSLSQIVTEERR
jgi:tetratricopeptide (TPR) repeat protein